MASNYTTNYQLNQWAKSDRLMMDDFNADNAKIDAALKEVADNAAQAPKIHFGFYTGDGADTRTIALDYTPRVVLLMPAWGQLYSDGLMYGGIAAANKSCGSNAGTVFSIVSNGIRVHYRSSSKIMTNYNNSIYYFIAIE